MLTFFPTRVARMFCSVPNSRHGMWPMRGQSLERERYLIEFALWTPSELRSPIERMKCVEAIVLSYRPHISSQRFQNCVWVMEHASRR